MTTAIVGALLAWQVWSLIRYLDKSNLDLQRFLQSINHDDLSQTISASGRGGSYAKLETAFNEIIGKFREARSTGEARLHYLQTIVQHIGVGLIAFDQYGAIELINPAARRLLGVGHIHSLDAIAEDDLAAVLMNLQNGDRTLIKLIRSDEVLQLSLEGTEFKQSDRVVKLVSLQDVSAELAEKEMESWQKLVRVLTHEIANSVSPIASLAGTLDKMLAPQPGGHVNLSAEVKADDDIRAAVRAIQLRSEGLAQFVGSYRSLTSIPKPSFRIIRVQELFATIQQLTATYEDLSSVPVEFTIEPAELELTADPHLLEQVLLNLIRNSAAALRDLPNGRIDLSAHLNDSGHALIQVADNGPGIEPEVIDKIFTPFFTTRAEGNGIGLSLSRQIMRLHKGDLLVTSSPHMQTVFTLRF